MRARRIFYEGIASTLGAGIPIRSALGHLTPGARGAFGEAMGHLLRAVDGGRALSDAMEERPSAFPRFHAELVRAAESSGTLDAAFRSLADIETAADRTRGKVIARLAYPVFVIHFAAIPLHIGVLMQGRFGKFALGVLALWLPMWGLGALAWWVFRKARTGGPAASLVLGFPFLGSMIRDRALLRWARVYAALDDAGVSADMAATRAAASTGFATIEAPLAAAAARLRTGCSRAEAFASAPIPLPFRAALARGEETGTLAESLGREADAMEHALEARGDSVMAILPAVAIIIAGAVVLFVALRFYGGIYSLR